MNLVVVASINVNRYLMFGINVHIMGDAKIVSYRHFITTTKK